MKKQIILSALIGMCAMLLFVNCGDDSPEEIPVVKALPMSITLDADGSVQMININSNTSWSVMRDSQGDS